MGPEPSRLDIIRAGEAAAKAEIAISHAGPLYRLSSEIVDLAHDMHFITGDVEENLNALEGLQVALATLKEQLDEYVLTHDPEGVI